jgi:hypothetical protein
MVTRKEFRQAIRQLSNMEEKLRQKTLQILRNTPDKEQAAYNISKQCGEMVRLELASFREMALSFEDNQMKKIRKIESSWKVFEEEQKAIFERLERKVEEDDQAGEEWKRGGFGD